MRYVVDTDWVADYLKGKSPAVKLLNAFAPDGLTISIITFPDLLIAATAIEHGLTLVTRNRRDFDRIPELSLYHEG